MSTLDNVAQLAGSLAEDEGSTARVRAHAEGTQLISTLINLRNGKGLTQRKIASKMGVNASKVCRMEAGSDDQLKWGDVLRYMRALDVNLSLLVDDPSLPAAERIKHHILNAHALLEQLRVLAQEMGEGDEITAKIKKFYGEVLFNFMIRLCSSYEKLPQSGPIPITSSHRTAPATSLMHTGELLAAER
jgi:transcriptional regulator with XRE-family HTH domain